MTPHPLEFPDAKEDQLDLSTIDISTLRPNGSWGGSPNEGEGEDMEAVSREDIAELTELFDDMPALIEIAEENEVMEDTELGVWLLSTQASAAESRFQQLGMVNDMEKAIEYRSEILSLTPGGHEEKPNRFGALGTAFLLRFQGAGDLADLNHAIEHLTQAVQLTADWNVNRLDPLGTLGTAYVIRFDRLGELADLNKAIEYLTQVVLLAPEGHPGKPTWFNNLGNSYQSRFGRLGELADLKRAIEYRTQAVVLGSDRDPDKPSWLGNLGGSYASRFRRLGELVDLNKAIEYDTQAVMLALDGHPHKPGLLSNLGASYHSRFERLDELVDLNKAIEYKTQAVLLLTDGHPRKPDLLNNLGNSYESRFQRLGELEDLNKAIEHQTQAVMLTPNDHAHNAAVLNNLGTSYSLRFGRLGELADLNKAIEYQTQAVLLTPDGHPHIPDLLNNLGLAYESRFRRLGELEDLDKAIEYQTQAFQLMPDGHAYKPMYLFNIGISYLSRFEHHGDNSDLQLAQSSFRQGAQLSLTHPQMQSRCARLWAQCSLLLGSSPQSAYERCIELIPHYIWLGTTIDQRYNLLREINDLATEAAAWAIYVKAFDIALEWLEEGRSIVWNQILQLRTPFDDLSLVDPVLAQDLKDTASKLEAAGTRQSASMSVNPSSDLEEDARYHHDLADKWEVLVSRARQTPGFHDFLRPRKVNELRLAATDGPIVVLNAYSTRCDALILFPGCEVMAHLPISNVSVDKLGEACFRLKSLVGHRGERAGGFKRIHPAPSPEDTFEIFLADLWSDIVKPVLDFLEYRHRVPVDEMPHVTWCTTGALSFLPLHAAGLYDGSQSNAFNFIVSSYTPTLSALLTHNTQASPTRLNLGLLAVGQEHTQGFCQLPYTVRELTAIKEHAAATQFHQLDGSSATIDAVLGAMDTNSWVHLACHATQNPNKPSRSAFHLHDGSLTLETITKQSFKNKGLAFLSACQTATGDEKLVDEAVHLAAGMLMAGYPSVIATMWSIQDEDGPQVADAVYGDLLKDGKMDHRQAARALHKAVAGLRQKVGNGEFERWVPFIHIGV